MQDESPLNDPALDAFARQLVAARPMLEARDRDALLYECGFAAGRQSAASALGRLRALAAGLAIVAVGLGVLSTGSHAPPPVAKAVAPPTSVVEQPPAPESAQAPILADVPRRDARRQGVLLANSSWEQVRASWESPSATMDVLSTPGPLPQQTMLRAGSAWTVTATAK